MQAPRKKLPIGIQPLFEGLYAAERWDWSKRYPVIRISFGGSVHGERALLAWDVETL